MLFSKITYSTQGIFANLASYAHRVLSPHTRWAASLIIRPLNSEGPPVSERIPGSPFYFPTPHRKCRCRVIRLRRLKPLPSFLFPRFRPRRVRCESAELLSTIRSSMRVREGGLGMHVRLLRLGCVQMAWQSKLCVSSAGQTATCAALAGKRERHR
jgi:hypothetical protein